MYAPSKEVTAKIIQNKRDLEKERGLRLVEDLLREELRNKTYLIVEGSVIVEESGRLFAREYFKSALKEAYVDPVDYEEHVSNLEKEKPELRPGTRGMAKLKIVPGTMTIKRAEGDIEVMFNVFNLNYQTISDPSIVDNLIEDPDIALTILITYGRERSLWLSIMGNEFDQTDFTIFEFR